MELFYLKAYGNFCKMFPYWSLAHLYLVDTMYTRIVHTGLDYQKKVVESIDLRSQPPEQKKNWSKIVIVLQQILQCEDDTQIAESRKKCG